MSTQKNAITVKNGKAATRKQILQKIGENAITTVVSPNPYTKTLDHVAYDFGDDTEIKNTVDINELPTLASDIEISDLNNYTNLKSKDLAKSFNNIEQAKGLIRLGYITIGRELAYIKESKTYLVDFPEYRNKFEKFVKDIMNIPKTTYHRYVNIYLMCCDTNGNICKPVAALKDSQLQALYKSHRNMSAGIILQFIDKITPTTKADEIVKIVNDYFTAAETSQIGTSETSDTDTDTDTDTNTDTTTNVKMISFKGALKGQTPIKVPENIINNQSELFKYLTERQPKTLSDADMTIYDIHIGVVISYIIVHDTEMKNIYTYYYKHGDYSKS